MWRGASIAFVPCPRGPWSVHVVGLCISSANFYQQTLLCTIEIPPEERTRPMPRPRRLPTVLTRPEVSAFLTRANPRYLTGHRDRCLIQLMLHAGLRAAEVLA